MKIGIITVQDSANYGSYLQAYAMQRVLINMGHDVTFIKTRNEKEVKKVFFGTLKNPKTFLKNYRFNNKKYKEFLKDREIFKEILLEDVKKDTFDIVIIGSDELWNVKTRFFTNNFFYGAGIQTKKKIAFAISMGTANANDFKNYPELVKEMKKLNNIYVRDLNTKESVKNLIGKDCEMVCDPTFLIDVQEFEKDYKNTIEKKYMLVYSYNFTQKQQEYIKRFAKENKLLIVSACFNHSFCDICANCSPLQFCQIIKDSSYVVTTTFHGTIFSILNKKQFISMPSGPKVEDVLDKFKLQQQKISSDDDYEIFKKKLLKKIDFRNSETELLAWRERTINYLSNTIEN